MSTSGRRGLSDDQQAEVWQRWKIGESLSEIGLALGKPASSIRCVLLVRGGVVPTRRCRSERTLSLSEREEISRGLSAGRSGRQIAAQLGRWPSTISREIILGGGRDGYRALEADGAAWDRARRPKACVLSQRRRLCKIVATKLASYWSPKQISGWLKEQYSEDETMQVSHETIYRSLFIQARNVLKKELIAHLRSRRTMRRSKLASTKSQSRGHIVDAVSIRERPAEVEDRAVPGHWEGDLLIGTKSSQIATLVERRSRFVMLTKLTGRDTVTVVSALSKHVRTLPANLRLSLTWDRGFEMADHKDFTVATDVKVYFCDPRSPWQRGSNENTNGLLRQYFPKGTDLSVLTQAELNRVARQLNERPRETLGFKTPACILGQSVAATD